MREETRGKLLGTRYAVFNLTKQRVGSCGITVGYKNCPTLPSESPTRVGQAIYSVRRVRMGSMDAARRAGIKAAQAETTPIARMAAAKLGGSKGDNW